MIVLYILLGIVVAFVTLQLFLKFKMSLKKGKPAPEISGKEGKAIRSGKRVLFYFYSPQCGACRTMTPVVEKMSKSNKNVFKVNVASRMDIAKEFGVLGTPSTVVVENGIIKEYIVGAKPESTLIALMG